MACLLILMVCAYLALPQCCRVRADVEAYLCKKHMLAPLPTAPGGRTIWKSEWSLVLCIHHVCCVAAGAACDICTAACKVLQV